MKKTIPNLSEADKKNNALKKEAFLLQLSQIPHQGTAGFFGPHSISWQLYREPLVLVGGIRALLLQIAHPAIADGVQRYSNFQEDALERGKRTFMAMAKIYFGDVEVAKKTALQLHTIHSFIKGTYKDQKDNIKSYGANDPDLLLWVLATLIDTTFLVFEKIKGILSTQQKQQFFEEAKTTAFLMGIPENSFPANLQEFNHYFSHTIKNELRVDETSLSLARAILNNRYSSKRISEALALGFLPEKLIVAFELDLSKTTSKRFKRIIKRIKFFYFLFPAYLRYAPAWHQARFRMAKAEGRRGKLLGRFYHWLSKRMRIPLGI